MIGIVGLENPGTRYADTRHNAGADFARALASKCGIDLRADKKLFASYGSSSHGDFWLATPDLFMNESGTAVAAIVRRRKIRPERILVAHDEIDLPLGVTRFKFGGGEAGHNGLRDITQKIGTRNYWRLRIGVGRPERGREDIADYVLRRPPPAEGEKIAAAIDRARTAMALLLLRAADTADDMRAIAAQFTAQLKEAAESPKPARRQRSFCMMTTPRTMRAPSPRG